MVQLIYTYNVGWLHNTLNLVDQWWINNKYLTYKIQYSANVTKILSWCVGYSLTAKSTGVFNKLKKINSILLNLLNVIIFVYTRDEQSCNLNILF